MPSLCWYCQGVIRYRIECQFMVDTAIILYKEYILRLWRCSWMTLVCRISGWWVQATSAINSMVCLQNLLGTTLVFRAAFKTKQQPPRRLLSIQPKSQTSTLTLSLHHLKPHSQSCAPSTNSRQLWGGRHQWWTRMQTHLQTQAVSARQLIWLLQLIPWTYKAPCCCIQAMRRRRWSSCAK